MGKKRNNAAKKKQVGKKKKISATYGVSVQKGGTIARNNGIIEPRNPMADNNKTTNNKQSMKSNNHHLSTDESYQSKTNQKKSGASHKEQNEFLREQASLEERSLMQQSQKKQQPRKSKNQKKGWGNNFAQPTSMAQPILNLNKTTQQLVDDAANQITQMSEIGQRLNPQNPAPEGQSSLAAAAGVNFNWSSNNNGMQEEIKVEQSQHNSFAALGYESDSDNEWADSKQQSKPPQFQFQPASFAFQSSFVPVGSAEDEIDPDL